MKDGYFTISEFAKLRNKNINSLRYYEKKGILKPSVVDEETGYRYYSLKQLSELEAVTLCIHLGISLKELEQFREPDGSFQLRRILECGRETLNERLMETQKELSRITSILHYLDTATLAPAEDTKPYKRHISRRMALAVPIEQDCVPGGLIMERTIAELYRKAEKYDVLPMLPVGLLIEYSPDGFKQSLMMGVIGETEGLEDVVELPEGDYDCKQIILNDTDIHKEIADFYGTLSDGRVVVENMLFDHYLEENARSEIQRLCGDK